MFNIAVPLLECSREQQQCVSWFLLSEGVKTIVNFMNEVQFITAELEEILWMGGKFRRMAESVNLSMTLLTTAQDGAVLNLQYP